MNNILKLIMYSLIVIACISSALWIKQLGINDNLVVNFIAVSQLIILAIVFRLWTQIKKTN